MRREEEVSLCVSFLVLNSLNLCVCVQLPAPSRRRTPGIPSRPASVGRSSPSRSHTPRSRSSEPLNGPEAERREGEDQSF